MLTKFLIFIAIVFIITIIFGVLIWRQTLVFERKALAAKQRKEAYLKQLEEEMQKQQEMAQQDIELAEPKPNNIETDAAQLQQ